MRSGLGSGGPPLLPRLLLLLLPPLCLKVTCGQEGER